jgi:ABC-2 type transport system ATP-binding protein
LEVRDLVKRYGARTVVAGVGFRAEPGSVLAVLGPNGAGKTTTIETCEGYRRPDAGQVRVLGLDPIAEASRLRPRVGVMLQDGVGGYTGARAGELLRLFASYAVHPLAPLPLLERVGLSAVAETQVKRLSGGQRQRLSLALALVGRPELVFLDEPTAGMDPQARNGTWELIRELRRDGLTVVLTTHLLDEAECLADAVVVLDAGRVVAAGTPAELTATQSDELHFSAPAGLDLSGLTAALPTAAAQVSEPVPGRYVIAGNVTPALVAAVAAWCAERDILARDLNVQRRRLEDVFLELTGRDLRT